MDPVCHEDPSARSLRPALQPHTIWPSTVRRLAKSQMCIIAIALIIGGIAGYKALVAPGGILLGAALVLLGIWIVKTTARRTA
jgi:hypothetical protein